MADRADKPKAHHLGHRQRLRERFINGGADALPDYELLELLLFNAQPRASSPKFKCPPRIDRRPLRRLIESLTWTW